MNISYNWLKDLVDFDLSPEELAKKLTAAGLAVEGIHPISGDHIFDIDLTSNRPDCLSHLGVAREVTAVSTESSLIRPRSADLSPSVINEDLVTIEDSDLCSRFTARIVRDVTIGPSPDWLVKRLEAVGERSINNVADITNYVMLELGQPMHSFDLKSLAENRIVVRRARTGETIKTLDEIERKLDESMLAICDAEKPLAVAGVMGGFDSGITTQTKDVLLEVAYFNRSSIYETSRKLNLSTEASYRFERGVDIENLIRASDRAVDLICELAGGKAGEFVDVYPGTFVPHRITSPDLKAATARLTGLTVEDEEIVRILTALGIKPEAADGKPRVFMSPSWRFDLSIEEDLVEEIARVIGYDCLESLLPFSVGAGAYQPTEPRIKLLRQNLVNLGFIEALSYSFIDEATDFVYDLVPDLVSEKLTEKFVTIKDPIIEGSTRMRPTILPGLLDAARTNFNHQNRDLKLFELGKVFAASDTEDGLPDERVVLAILITGQETLENRAMTDRELNFYDAKGAVEAAADAINAAAPEFIAADFRHLRHGQSAAIRMDKQGLGSIGRLNDEISAKYKFKQPVFVAEIDLETLLETGTMDTLYQPLPIFPAIIRDVSLLVNRGVTFAELKSNIAGQNFELLRSVRFVDIYEGKGIGTDERSITLRLEYRSDQRTLQEEEIESVHIAVLSALKEGFDAKQRF